MARNNHSNGSERRLAFLEKVYLEDRVRWQQSEARWQKLGAYVRSGEMRWQRREQVTRELLQVVKRQGDRLEALSKGWHRRSEGR